MEPLIGYPEEIEIGFDTGTGRVPYFTAKFKILRYAARRDGTGKDQSSLKHTLRGIVRGTSGSRLQRIPLTIQKCDIKFRSFLIKVLRGMNKTFIILESRHLAARCRVFRSAFGVCGSRE